MFEFVSIMLVWRKIWVVFRNILEIDSVCCFLFQVRPEVTQISQSWATQEHHSCVSNSNIRIYHSKTRKNGMFGEVLFFCPHQWHAKKSVLVALIDRWQSFLTKNMQIGWYLWYFKSTIEMGIRECKHSTFSPWVLWEYLSF